MFSFQYEIVCDSVMLVTNHIPAIREIRHLFLQWQFIQFNSTIHFSAHSLYIHIQVTQITVPSINHTIWIYWQSWDRNLFLSRSATAHHMGEAMPPAAARQPKDVVTWVIATMQLCNSANAGVCNCRVTARWQAVMTAPEDRNCDSFAEFGVWTSILQIQQLHSFHNLKGQVSKFQTERQCLNAHL